MQPSKQVNSRENAFTQGCMIRLQLLPCACSQTVSVLCALRTCVWLTDVFQRLCACCIPPRYTRTPLLHCIDSSRLSSSAPERFTSGSIVGGPHVGAGCSECCDSALETSPLSPCKGDLLQEEKPHQCMNGWSWKNLIKSSLGRMHE